MTDLLTELSSEPIWEACDTKVPVQGQLVWTLVPYIENVVHLFNMTRANPGDHHEVIGRIEPMLKHVLPKPSIPVASFPLESNEAYRVNRSKIRPALLLYCNCTDLKAEGGKGNYHLIAPLYGVDPSSKRSGYPAAFIEKVAQFRYPELIYFANTPMPRGVSSILRLDNIQPVGNNHNNYRLIGHKLSYPTLQLVFDMLKWMFTNEISELLNTYKDLADYTDSPVLK